MSLMSLPPPPRGQAANVVQVPPTPPLAPAMEPGMPEKIIGYVTLASVIVAFAVRRLRKHTPVVVAFILDLLPIVWMFFFTWALVHHVSDLIPARKHPPFNGNAFTSAGLITFIAALIPRRQRGAGVGIMGLVLSFLAMADILHMRIFGNVMPVGSHGSIFQLWDVRASIVSLFEKGDKWILAYVATSVVMLAVFRVREIEKTRNLRIAMVFAYVVPAFFVGKYFLPRVHDDVAGFLDSKWAREVLNREDQVWNSGFIEAHVREISLNIRHALDHKDPTKEELAQVEAYYREEHAEHYTADRPSFGKFKGKNLLVIQIEAFEEWLIGATINGAEVTPTLNRLREQALYYPNIFNEVATTPTADCEYLFLNSNHPLPDGAVAFRRENNHFVTLATTLRDSGYSTVSMHGYRKGMWNRAVVHPRYGFTHSLFADEIGMKPEIGWGLDDHVLMDDIAIQVKKEPAPWFLYAITLSSHHPYNSIPYNKRRLKVGALDYSMVGAYLHSAAFVDDALKGLFDKLKEADVLKDTIVVMYGDHDGHLHATPQDRQNLAAISNLPRRKVDYIGAGGSATANDKTDGAGFWYRNRIPLFILLPDGEKAVAPVYGAQIDFAPTLLHYLGFDAPRSFMGHAILPDDVGGFVARWDGSFVAPPLIYDGGLEQCRVLADLRVVSPDDCRAGADKARRELDMSWKVTNNDLARWLVERAKPVDVPKPAPANGLGSACQADADCKGPAGFDTHCLGGICVTDPHGPCAPPGSTAPCALGSDCYAFDSELNVCAADCEVSKCAGQCSDAGACGPKK